jgi:Ca2+/Na+ antiporter
MVLLRYLYVVALVVWVGGLIVAGALVAPSVFGVLQAWNEAQGRVLAGQVFGEILVRLTWLSYAMGAVMFVTLTLHRLLGARPLRYGVRIGIIGMMLAMMFATGFYIIPRVNTIQAEVKGPVSALADTDVLRVEFNRLHGLSNILFSITAMGGLALCFWEARE